MRIRTMLSVAALLLSVAAPGSGQAVRSPSPVRTDYGITFRADPTAPVGFKYLWNNADGLHDGFVNVVNHQNSDGEWLSDIAVTVNGEQIYRNAKFGSVEAVSIPCAFVTGRNTITVSSTSRQDAWIILQISDFELY